MKFGYSSSTLFIIQELIQNHMERSAMNDDKRQMQRKGRGSTEQQQMNDNDDHDQDQQVRKEKRTWVHMPFL